MNEWSGGCIDHASCLEQTVLRRSLSIASEPTKKTSKKTGRRGIIMIVVVVINTVSISNAQFKCGSNSFQSNLQRDIQFFFGNGRCSVDHTIYVGWSAWLADCRIVNPDLRSSSSYYIFIFSTRLLPTEKKISFLSQKNIIHEIGRIDYIVNNKYMM